MSPRLDPSILLAQASWARGLARTLVSDAHAADDLVQDAWVAALERPPDLGRPLRGWLASVLRNRWLDLRRAGDRRERRERETAADEAWPSSHAVVERAAMLRELVEAVLDLPEPYRTTILLRFFEELPQREIARRMRTSTATVNSRLARALAKLRERLARGDRGSWLHVLVPLLREPSAPAAAAGALVMKSVAVSVLAAASLVLGFVLWRSRTHPERTIPSQDRPPPQVASSGLAGEPPASAVVESPAAEGDGRVAVRAEPRPPATPPDASPPPARVLQGRVLD